MFPCTLQGNSKSWTQEYVILCVRRLVVMAAGRTRDAGQSRGGHSYHLGHVDNERRIGAGVAC